MCTLLKVANRRPVNLISPFFVHEEQITSVGSTGDNSAVLARFSYTVHVFSAFWHFRRPLRTASALVLVRNTTQRVCNALQRRTAPVVDYLPTSSNYVSAQCQAELDLEVQPKRDFERLTLANRSEVHAQGYVRFVLHCGDYNCKILARVFPNLQ